MTPHLSVIVKRSIVMASVGQRMAQRPQRMQRRRP